MPVSAGRSFPFFLRRFGVERPWPFDGTNRRRDPLTGLFDRAAFDRELVRRLRRSTASGIPRFAVVLIDLCRFKAVNDAHGHAAGDALLAALAARFEALRRPNEMLARLGGDEFAALVPFDDPAELDATLSRLRFAVAAPFSFDGFAATCGAGLGVALAPADGTEPATLLARADLALYRAKRGGRSSDGQSGCCFFDHALDEAQRRRRDLGAQLLLAIGSPGLHLGFRTGFGLSPDLRRDDVLPNGGPAFREAFPHWDHPALGPIPAVAVLPLAEESAAALPLGIWMLREACAAAATWPEPVPVAIDVPPLLLADPAFPDAVSDALDESALPPGRLWLEVTEHALLRDRDRAMPRLRTLHALGVKLVLDEFGPAPCSLELLGAFPFDRLKLHPSVLDPGSGPTAPAAEPPPLLSTLVAHAHRLGIPVVAGGADTAALLSLARRAGCDAVQGDAVQGLAPGPAVQPIN
ncbi:MAG: EAL domain-containing protein [Gluconacetobacter diazotrophicus]|nr:EAL domain-containing protein [Gluconacetobacter diazotrophicus]